MRQKHPWNFTYPYLLYDARTSPVNPCDEYLIWIQTRKKIPSVFLLSHTKNYICMYARSNSIFYTVFAANLRLAKNSIGDRYSPQKNSIQVNYTVLLYLPLTKAGNFYIKNIHSSRL